MKPVFADYASATPTDPRVVAAMRPYFEEFFANPSSQHQFGNQATQLVEEGRATLAKFIGGVKEDIYFTGSGTESNNLAIQGVAKANRARGNHIITTKIEHPSTINTCRALERDGFEVTYLSVDCNGQLNPEDLEKAIKPTTFLFTTFFANSELGTIQEVRKLGKICRSRNVLFHLDACQAVTFLPINVENIAIDLLTLSGDKMYGPKGSALLYVAANVSIFPIIYGGGQQKSLRSGTENVPGIAGLAEAAQIISERQTEDTKAIGAFRDQLVNLLKKLARVTFNVEPSVTLPNYLSFRFDSQSTGRDLVKEMDELGVAVAAGSACSATSIVESYVLRGIGLSSAEAQNTLRITLGRQTTLEDVEKIAQAVAMIGKR